MKKLFFALLLTVCSAFLFAGELADLKKADAWNIRFPLKRQQAHKTIQHSLKEGITTEITAVPDVFKYTELFLKEPVVLADKQENFKGIVSLRLKADDVKAFQSVSIRLEDASGEVRQYRKVVKLRPGEMETIRIPVAWNVPPERVWGNRDKSIDYPIKFTGLKFDYNPAASVRLTIADLQWEAASK